MIRHIGATILAAVASIGLASIAAADPITITFRFNDTEAEVRGAIDKFERNNPDIKVELQRIGWRDAQNQFLREAAAGGGPDVIHSAQVWVKEMGQAGAALPLDDLIKADGLPNGFADFVAQDLAKGPEWQYLRPAVDDRYLGDGLPDGPPEERRHPKAADDLGRAARRQRRGPKKTGKAGFGYPAGSSASGAIWFLANFYWWSHDKSLIVQKSDGSYAIGLTPSDVAEAMRYYKSYLDDGDNPKMNIAASDAHDPAILKALVSGNQAMAAMPPEHLHSRCCRPMPMQIPASRFPSCQPPSRTRTERRVR